MICLTIGILGLIALLAWWLTGLDRTVSGESKRSHYFTRGLRCVAVVFLVAVFLWFAEGGGGPAGAVMLLIVPLSIALVLRSSVAEVFSQIFLRFTDPGFHDHRPIDPAQSRRRMDAIARLIHNGQREEAVKLCEELKQCGEVDIVTLENTLEFLGVPQNTRRENPLRQAAQLRTAGEFADAEALLKSLLKLKPSDTGAAMMLMRLYAQNFRQPEKAREVLAALERQPLVDAGHVEFARHSIDEWSRRSSVRAVSPARLESESIEDLLAQGFFGSAIERLEEQIKRRPQDFDLQVKLAEVHGVNCRNLQRAEKIIRQMEPNFSPQQIESARVRLADWRKRRTPHTARLESCPPAN